LGSRETPPHTARTPESHGISRPPDNSDLSLFISLPTCAITAREKKGVRGDKAAASPRPLSADHEARFRETGQSKMHPKMVRVDDIVEQAPSELTTTEEDPRPITQLLIRIPRAVAASN